MQCSHAEGWRKMRQGTLACKVCGTIRGAPERWVLVPRNGKKIIGRKRFPNSGGTFPDKKAATIVDDTIDFHGARLHVDVHNSYRSRLCRRSELDISVAAERIVRVQEGSTRRGHEAPRAGGSTRRGLDIDFRLQAPPRMSQLILRLPSASR